MREIVIKTYYREKSEYVVRLGNGTCFKFRSEKATKRFLADTNRFLSETAFRLNQVLVELYQHGREVWLVAPDFKITAVQSEISSLEHNLKQAYDRAGWKSGNYFVFIDLLKFCHRSKALIKVLLNVKKISQADTIRRHRLNLLFDQVQHSYLKLVNYGQADAFELFDTSKIEHVSDVIDFRTNLKVA
jgi:hypothetical protein